MSNLYIVHDTACPKFGKIFDLITLNNNSNLILCVVEYYGDYVPHYNAFKIKTKGVISAFTVSSLSDHRPLMAHHSFESSDHNLYIILP